MIGNISGGEPILKDAERINPINDSLKLIESPDAIPLGTDSYLLAAFVRRSGGVAADFGAGNGAAGLLCLSYKKVKLVYSIEMRVECVDLISRNAALNGFRDELIPMARDVRDLRAADFPAALDAVFTNPPYFRAGSGVASADSKTDMSRREYAGGICEFCAAAFRVLKNGGLFYAVYGPERLADLLCAARDAKLEPKRIVFVSQKPGDKPSLVLMEAKKHANPGLKIERQLSVKDSYGNTSRDFNTIYNTCSFDSFFGT